MHKYKIRYDIDTETRPEGYTKYESGDMGLTDNILVISCINNEDGSYSQMYFSVNGETQVDMIPEEIFKCWNMLGMSLSKENKLTGWHKDCVDSFADAMRRFMKMGAKLNG